MASTWQQWERAVAAGHMRYLYRIQFKGRTMVTDIPYVTGREPLEFEGITYLPHPCVHEDIKFDEIGAETVLKVPAAKLWIETCLKHSPRVSLEVFRWREELADAQSMFYGNLVNTSFADADINMDFGTPLGAANVQLVTYYTQRYCNHDMYGQYCGLDFDSLKLEVDNYLFETNRRVDLGGMSLDKEYWKNALIFYTIKVTDGMYDFHIEESNMVKSMEGGTLVLKYAVSQYIDTTMPIYIAPNCLLNLDRCQANFGNLPRACAWPDMPRANYTMMDVTSIGKGNNGNIGGPR